MTQPKYEHETTEHQYITVKMPVETYNRITSLLTNLTKENRGWLGFLSRWKISHEPLRHDAQTLWDELSYMESRRKIIRDSRTVEISSATPRSGN